jgi:hypothetical protein
VGLDETPIFRPDFPQNNLHHRQEKTMKKVGCYLTVAVFTLALTVAAHAGQMDTTPSPMPDPTTTATSQDSTGQTDAAPSTNTSGSADTVETLAAIALDIYQSVNP